MKGLGWIVVLAGLLGVTYLVVQDLDVLTGEDGEQVVLQPLERARDTAALVQRTESALKDALDKIDK